MLHNSKRFVSLALIFAIAGLVTAGRSVRAGEPSTKPAVSSVIIDAYWLRLTPAELPVGQATIPASLLNDANVLYARTRIVGFDGEEVTADVTHTVNVVTSATPIVAPGVSTYELNTTPEKFGVTLTETPTQTTNDSLQLSFDSTVSIQQENPAGASATRPSSDPAVQPNPMVVDAAHGVVGTSSVLLHAKSTLMLKVGVPTVVSGMSDQPGTSDGRVLCLVLCATVSPAK